MNLDKVANCIFDGRPSLGGYVYCDDITAIVIGLLIKRLPLLESFTAYRADHLTDSSIQRLARHHRSHFDLSQQSIDLLGQHSHQLCELRFAVI